MNGERLTPEMVKDRLDFEAFFRAELGDLRPGGNGNALALCPFHPDRDPSLSVNLASGLFKCFACDAVGDVFTFFQRRYNCDFPTALEALARFAGLDRDGAESRPRKDSPGLTLVEFAAAKKLPVEFLRSMGVKEARDKDGRPYLVFEYRGLNGQVIPEATRMRFSMAEKPRSKKGGKPAVYGLWLIPKFLTEDGELLIFEGESDSLTAWHYGLPALGLPGKGMARLLDPTILDGFRSAFVWQEPGAEDFPANVAKALPGFRVLRMVPPEGLKDISEAHIRGLDVLALVREMQREATEVPATDFSFIIGAGDLLSTPFATEDEVIGCGILPAGGGLILAGEAGDGKSLLRTELAIYLGTGMSAWGLEIPLKRRVLIIQSENTLKNEAYRLRRMLAGLELPQDSVNNRLFFAEPHLRFNLATRNDVDKLSSIIKESKADVVIYDPLTSFHNVNENDNVAIRNVLDTITMLNRTLHVTSIVIHHFGKPNDTTSNAYRTRGASSIKDWADTLAILTRKKHEHKVLRQLEFLKVRNGPEPKPILLLRDEYFLHWPEEEDMLCPPEMVQEIIKRQGGRVSGYEKLQELIAHEVRCSKRSAAKFIRLAVDRGSITATTDPVHRQRKVYVA